MTIQLNVLRALLAIAVLALSTTIRAQPEAAEALTIREAIDKVLANAVRAKTAHLDLGTQLKQAALGRRDFVPQAVLSGQSERSNQDRSASASLSSTWKMRTGASLSAAVGRSVVRSPSLADATRQTGTTTTQSLGLTQPLLRGAGTEVATVNERQSDLSSNGARRDFAQAMADLVFDTVSAYFALEQARRNVALARETIERLQKMRAVNDALLAAGRIPRTTLLQNDLDEAQATFSLAQAEQAETVAQRTLLRLLTSDAQDPDRARITLGDSFAGLAERPALDEREAMAIALERRSDVRSARDAVASARLSLVSARDALRDQLDVYAKVDRQRSTLPLAPPTTTNVPAVGVQFSMTLDKTALHTAADTAGAGVTKAELALAEAERNAIAETRDALKAIDFAQAQHRLAQRTAELAARRLDDEVEKTRAGRSSATELTQAQDALRDARSQEVQARYAIFTARLDLQRVTGTILEQWGVDGQVAAMQPPQP